jgi:hypothetical protein
MSVDTRIPSISAATRRAMGFDSPPPVLDTPPPPPGKIITNRFEIVLDSSDPEPSDATPVTRRRVRTWQRRVAGRVAGPLLVLSFAAPAAVATVVNHEQAKQTKIIQQVDTRIADQLRLIRERPDLATPNTPNPTLPNPPGFHVAPGNR